jgi:hypothetical protein
MWKRVLLLLSLTFCFATAGCEFFNPIGPMIQLGIYWYEGEAHKYYATDQPTIDKALRSALNEVAIPINSEETKGDTIYLRAGGKMVTEKRLMHSVSEDRFKIKVTKVNEKVTKLSIRVNVFGDKPFAELIYRHVDQQPGVRQFATSQELHEAVNR